MYYLSALIYGMVQGVAEFLPISSSGHLALLHQLLPTPFENELAFDVTLHLGTLLAVAWYFKSSIKELFVDFIGSFKSSSKGIFSQSWLVIWGTMPAALIGVKFGDQIEVAMGQPLIIAAMLILVGILFIVMENVSKKERDLTELNFKDAILIGLSQVIALIPGTSRSGITIIAGLGRGLKRESAVRFSFLLSLVIIAGASLLKVPKLFQQALSGPEWFYLSIAFITASLSGLWAISFLMKFVANRNLKPFAYYRFLLAAVIIINYLVAH